MAKPAPLPPHGVILYDGPSMLDGYPVVVVLTSIRGTSSNTKTSGDGDAPVLRIPAKATVLRDR